MDAKRKPGRFTLQFNQEDPQQRMVSELLEQQGRHKAQFITSAILSYIQCSSKDHDDARPAIDEAVLERMLLSIMEKNPRFAAAISGELPKIEGILAKPTSPVRPWENTISDDALRAITDTLAAFQTG